MHPPTAAAAAPSASTTITAATAIEGGASGGRARLAAALCGVASALAIWCYGGGGGGGGLGGGRLTTGGPRARFIGRSEGAGREAKAGSTETAHRARSDENHGGGVDREDGAATGDGDVPPPPPSRAATRPRQRGRARGQQRRATTLKLDGEAAAREERNVTTHDVRRLLLRLPLPRDGDGDGDGGGEEGLTRRYDSFEQYAEEHFARVGTAEPPLPVPIVPSRKGPKFSSSLPAAIIIGVQKGGTQNLRCNLLSHPSLSGMMGKEAHFFNSAWVSPPPKHRREWPGDAHREKPLEPGVVGALLSAYAHISTAAIPPADRDTMVGVDSTPLYAFHPLVPYRMKMVLPRARIVLLLRDPTERYYSQAAMVLCMKTSEESFEDLQERVGTSFHGPGRALAYLEQAEASYEPYTALCRGEGATADDLRECLGSMKRHNPLHRGLYADQLERWFRVFDRSQILIVESGEMFQDVSGTLEAVARHAGLPPHDFKYNPVYRHSRLWDSSCPDLFAKGARYDQMKEDEEIFRDWYRPHNQRLNTLLGREMPWR